MTTTIIKVDREVQVDFLDVGVVEMIKMIMGQPARRASETERLGALRVAFLHSHR